MQHGFATQSDITRWTVRTATAKTRALSGQRLSAKEDQSFDRENATYLLGKMEAVFGGYVGGREWYFAMDWGVAFVGDAVMGGAEAASYDGD
ncbi:Hypothetical protein, putative, partial [Bodo saltans]